MDDEAMRAPQGTTTKRGPRAPEDAPLGTEGIPRNIGGALPTTSSFERWQTRDEIAKLLDLHIRSVQKRVSSGDIERIEGEERPSYRLRDTPWSRARITKIAQGAPGAPKGTPLLLEQLLSERDELRNEIRASRRTLERERDALREELEAHQHTLRLERDAHVLVVRERDELAATMRRKDLEERERATSRIEALVSELHEAQIALVESQTALVHVTRERDALRRVVETQRRGWWGTLKMWLAHWLGS